MRIIKGTKGVQHGVMTRLPSFMIIRESIDITTLSEQIAHSPVDLHLKEISE